MKRRICFVDDDGEFEIPLFRDVFGDVFDVVAATSYEELKSRIQAGGDWRPELFVLDLYFPSGAPDRVAVAALRDQPLRLSDDGGEIRAAYTNVRRAEERLRRVLGAWRQGPDGGLALAERIAADFPGVPIVFYSRKATVEDVVRCMAAENVRWIERKPTGADDAETAALTRQARGEIVERFEKAIVEADSERIGRLKRAARLIRDFLRQTLRP